MGSDYRSDLEICHPVPEVDIQHKDCSTECSWHRKPRRRYAVGDRIVYNGGYVYVKCPDHPNANAHGFMREHRLVMEAHIDRLLTKKEVVHHKNKIKTDNRIENLELFASSGDHMRVHTGKRLPQYVCRICGGEHFGLGLCKIHYGNYRRNSGLDKTPCAVCGKLIYDNGYKSRDGLNKCRTCRWPKVKCKFCNRIAKVKGLCKPHYAGATNLVKCSACGKDIRKHGRVCHPPVCWSCTYPKIKCRICGKKHEAKGLCENHYKMFKRGTLVE